MWKSLASIGHLSPIEHVSFTFGIEGISRACSHQLVRHRVASYSQQSQRYVKEEQFDYVIPPSIKQDPALVGEFEKCMAEAQENYTKVLKRLEELGYKGEAGQQDARYLLPNAAETKIVVTMNARELLHFFRVRCCNRAQWEIREMADRMLALVKKDGADDLREIRPRLSVRRLPRGQDDLRQDRRGQEEVWSSEVRRGRGQVASSKVKQDRIYLFHDPFYLTLDPAVKVSWVLP